MLKVELDLGKKMRDEKSLFRYSYRSDGCGENWMTEKEKCMRYGPGGRENEWVDVSAFKYLVGVLEKIWIISGSAFLESTQVLR